MHPKIKRRAGMRKKWRKDIAKVSARHIHTVIDQIKTRTMPVPLARRARKWWIRRGGLLYPTKFVLAMAVELASGRHFPPSARSGGAQTIGALRKAFGNDPRLRIVQRRRRLAP